MKTPGTTEKSLPRLRRFLTVWILLPVAFCSLLGVISWYQLTHTLDAAALRAGGFVDRYSHEPLWVKPSRLWDRDDSGRFIHITFQDNTIDDAWLEQHAALLAREPRLNLNLRHCRQVTDRGLMILSTMKHLEGVSLADCPVSRKGLRSLTQVSGLTSLSLMDVNVQDADLELLAEMPRLFSLGLGSSFTTSVGLQHVLQCPNLGMLHLVHVNDESLAVLKGHPKMGSLVIRGDGVTDASIPVILSMPKLHQIWLVDTQVTQTGHDQLLNAFPRAEIKVTNSEKNMP